MKARGCADGRKQEDMYTKEEAASPTVATESVLLTEVIDAREGQEVAFTDIPGTYLNAGMDEYVLMVVRGRLAEMMVITAPEIYRKYIKVNRKGKLILYLRLQKTLYRCLQSSLIFYKRPAEDLQEYGFKTKWYDMCVANKIVNGKQLTVV